MSGIVVVDQPRDDRVVIWHVSVGDGLESTMAGAWVFRADDDQIAGLLVNRLLVSTAGAAARFGTGAALGDLATAIRHCVETLNEAFTRHVASLPASRRKLVPPAWPLVADAPTPERAGEPLATEALTMARWGSNLLTAWAEVERQRLTRPFLVDLGGPTAREYPPGWPNVEAGAEDGAAA